MKAKSDLRPEGPPARKARLPRPTRLFAYLLKELMGPVALLTLLLTSVIWLVSILPLLDLVINQGQSAWTFLSLIILMLPTPLVMILPVAFFFATLFTLQRLQAESELVVMASAGFSLRQLAAPVLAAGAIVMALTYACVLFLAPAGQRVLGDKLMDIRADIAGALLSEGEFKAVSQGITVFLRQLSRNGEIRGILVHDNRNRAHPVTYIAEKGILAKTPMGTRLIMQDGTIETGSQGGKQLQVLSYRSHVMDLDQFSGPARMSARKKEERFLNDLLWPPEPDIAPRLRDQFFAAAHDRLSQPLYCIAFALIAMAAVMRGRRQRGKIALRLTVASLAAAGLRIAGYGVLGMAQHNPALIIGFYLLPLLGAAGAIVVLAGYSPSSLRERFRVQTA